jgi:hypothetical protein
MLNFIKEIKIKDIMNYEMTEGINLLNELEELETYVIIDLIKMSNKCNDEIANKILEDAMKEYSLAEICIYVGESIVGKQMNDSDEAVDKDKYSSFSDCLEQFYSQIQIVDTLSFGDFMEMSTRQLYRYSDGLQKRYINKKNQELQSQFTNISMLMSGLAGKLKECPQLDENGKMKKKDIFDQIAELKAMTSNKK